MPVFFALAMTSAWVGNVPTLAHYKAIFVAAIFGGLGWWFGRIYLRRRRYVRQRNRAEFTRDGEARSDVPRRSAQNKY